MTDYLLISIYVLIGGLSSQFVIVVADNLPYQRYSRFLFRSNCENNLSSSPRLQTHCSNCNSHYAMRNWIVLLLFIFLSIWISIKVDHHLSFWCYWLEIIYFSTVAVIDHENRIIPYPISFVGLVLGAGLGVWKHGWWETVIGFITGFGFVLIIFVLGYFFSKCVVKNINTPALGFGDVLITGIAGLFLGFPGIIISVCLLIFVASLISLSWIFILIMKKQYQPFSNTLPMGSLLSIITVILLLTRIN